LTKYTSDALAEATGTKRNACKAAALQVASLMSQLEATASVHAPSLLATIALSVVVILAAGSPDAANARWPCASATASLAASGSISLPLTPLVPPPQAASTSAAAQLAISVIEPGDFLLA
jgi:hypothetical protein